MSDAFWNSEICKGILAAASRIHIATGEMATCCATEPREIAKSNATFVISNIIESKWLTKRVQVRRPKSKKRRIQKKWAKRDENFRSVPDEHIYLAAGRIICHPQMARELRERFLLDGELNLVARQHGSLSGKVRGA